MELIIDIETVSGEESWTHVSSELKLHWQNKVSFLKLNEEEQEDNDLSYFNRAGIYAEFGKIICIGIGLIDYNKKEIRVKTLANDSETDLLQEFIKIINKIELEHKTPVLFCGHNIKEFDLPYICRRMIINGIPLPNCLQISGLKPWQVSHKDTLEMWRFGDYKHYISLDLLANILNVPSSKSDINGSEVNNVYWNEEDLNRIAQYCSRDIFTTALVYLKLKQDSIAEFEKVDV